MTWAGARPISRFLTTGLIADAAGGPNAVSADLRVPHGESILQRVAHGITAGSLEVRSDLQVRAPGVHSSLKLV